MGYRTRIEEVLGLLADELRRRAELHPHGHLLGRRGESLSLRVDVPLDDGEAAADAATRALDDAVEEALADLLAQRAAIAPGRAFCLRCREAGCQHAVPGGPRQVFAGYGATGLPRFEDFGQWLLERGDERLERLYASRPELLAHSALEEELTRDLLPAFRDGRGSFRLHGQVAAGWFRVPGTGRSDPFAVTFQVVSMLAGGRRRFALNVCGIAPGGGALPSIRERGVTIPWIHAVHWAQNILEQVEREQAQRRKRAPRQLARRIEGLLTGLARRVEQGERSKSRRTQHAELRHAEGSRPTRMALSDLARAEGTELLVDARQGTLVVLGERGRTHFFNDGGKLVTSVRYSPAAVEKRRQTGRWKPAPEERVSRIRELLTISGTREEA